MLFRLLSASKYPASPLFLLMTLGPTIAILPLVERARGWLADVVGTFGRVPMFYYLLHIPTIHVTALLVNLLRTGSTNAGPYATAPYVDMPPGRSLASVAAVRRVRRGRRAAVLSMPVVCGCEGEAAAPVDELRIRNSFSAPRRFRGSGSWVQFETRSDVRRK